MNRIKELTNRFAKKCAGSLKTVFLSDKIGVKNKKDPASKSLGKQFSKVKADVNPKEKEVDIVEGHKYVKDKYFNHQTVEPTKTPKKPRHKPILTEDERDMLIRNIVNEKLIESTVSAALIESLNKFKLINMNGNLGIVVGDEYIINQGDDNQGLNSYGTVEELPGKRMPKSAGEENEPNKTNSSKHRNTETDDEILTEPDSSDGSLEPMLRDEDPKPITNIKDDDTLSSLKQLREKCMECNAYMLSRRPTLVKTKKMVLECLLI
eukprot:gnl/Chilomastix_caulleri/4238.p1 GENE.gnl/Chilomastix_caulleri/4238~~gnl/Chilomastix_caulleri/4238.p1  ORF type:complete len:265 (+),score=50.26 gnl/Chilomastix_caulleri/4238:80-874(+)